ncbi:Gfo/Idh/MocA family protein [Paenibacillus koleovorans]|uniref:Gfo/Idh/MocA family protein n=1 Tax=Paenibacillus koleovorans TaxID=121608 RepID=UPI0013E32046|nr:Gfo/Idh/MocA family oxidoreductase [Paenibacillus koleovorans]
MAKEKVRIGYVGCGVMGRVYMKAAQAIPPAVSEAVTDLNLDLARAAADEFRIAKVYATAEELFRDPAIDAVVLALPTAFRTPLALQALQAGKHVLTEKPVAMHADEVKQLIQARGSLKVGCCSARLRCQDSAEAVASVVASGQLGEIRVLHSRWQTAVKPKPDVPPPLWRLSKSVNGGGNLANLGSYALDYMLGIVNWRLRPEHVFARTWSVPDLFQEHVAPGTDAESLTTAMITFEGGPVLMLEQGEFAVGRQETVWRITGTHGSLSFRILPSKQTIVLDTYRDGAQSEEVVWEGEENFATMQQRLLADFVQAIVLDQEPKTNLEQAYVVRRVMDAIYESATLGHSVPYEMNSIVGGITP